MAGLSLVRSSAHFAFGNATIQPALIQNGTMCVPLANSFAIMTNVVGPFGSVDMHHVPVLSQGNATQTVNKSINVPVYNVLPIPKAWTDLDFLTVGGSPLCPKVCLFGRGHHIKWHASLMSWKKQCSALRLAIVGVSIDTMIGFVVLVNMSQGTPHEIAQICAQNPSYVDICTTTLSETVDFVATYVASHLVDIDPVVQQARAAIRALNVEFLQFGHVNASSPLDLFRIHILEPFEVEFTYF
ncbi:hypothetical protein As57867_005746, partial [Aphanomyces stellatus]